MSSYKYGYSSIGNIRSVVVNNDTKRYYYDNGTPIHAPNQLIDRNTSVLIRSPVIIGDAKNKTLELYLVNNRGGTIEANVTVDFGDKTTVAADSVNVGGNVSIDVDHNYSNGGTYRVHINASTIYGTDQISFDYRFGVRLNELNALSEADNTVLEVVAFNDMEEDAINTNWSCDNGDVGAILFSLIGNRQEFIFINHNYTLPGPKSVVCNITSDDGNDTSLVDFTVRGLEMEEADVGSFDYSNKVMMFTVINKHTDVNDLSWAFKSDGTTITSSDTFNISYDNQTLVIIQTNYSTPGWKDYTLNVTSGDVSGWCNETVKIKALEFDDYDMAVVNETSKVYMSLVTNYWPTTQMVDWELNSPSVSSSSQTELNNSKSVMIIVEGDYDSPGEKDVNFSASSAVDYEAWKENFTINMIEIQQINVLKETKEQTVEEILVKNNIDPLDLTFRHDTGEENITDTVSLSTEEDLLVIVETNYSHASQWLTETAINSSSYSVKKDDGVTVS